MENIDVLTDIAERVAEYRMFYPDTTLTTISSNSEETFSDKEAMELSQKVCSMTISGLLQYKKAGRSLFIFKSRKFLEVSEGFKKGAKVRFHDPRTPDDHHESVMLADGMRYDGGIPFIWTEDSDADCFDECNTFAVYWRPVEEEGK
ncbi:hypothetical protein ACQRAV_11800 [Segatella copri]|uniref:hypothetical protein n=1 Tax=Segatella copri TaxID=165179 RepID=UPI003D0446AA